MEGEGEMVAIWILVKVLKFLSNFLNLDIYLIYFKHKIFKSLKRGLFPIFEYVWKEIQKLKTWESSVKSKFQFFCNGKTFIWGSYFLLPCMFMTSSSKIYPRSIFVNSTVKTYLLFERISLNANLCQENNSVF